MKLSKLALRFLPYALLILNLISVLSCKNQMPSAPPHKLQRPLVVGVVAWPGYAGGIVANRGFEPNEQSLFFRNYGLKVRFVLIEDTDARGKAFAKGGPQGVDAVWSTIDFFANELPNLVQAGIHAKAIMQVDWSQGGDALVAEASVRTVEDLADKKVALVQFTPSHWLLENVLQGSQMNEKSRQRVLKNLVFSQDVTSARQAFVARQVDAAVLWEPEVSGALRQRPGSRILVSTATTKDLIADIVIVKENFIQAHPATVEAFIRGWFDGVREVRQDPSLAVKVLMQTELMFRDLGPEITGRSLGWVKLADLDDNVRMYGLNGGSPLFDEIFSRAGQTWFKRGYISAPAPPASARDESFLKRIYDRQ